MFVIGISGGSGSGKSTLVENLLALDVAGHVAHLPHDAYYLARADMPEAIRAADNWDHPAALNSDLFVRHIDALRSGAVVQRPTYDFATHRPAAATVPVEPRAVLIVEGILLFHLPAVRERLDLKVYVETPPDLRILRRVVRDVRERGRTVEDVVEQYTRTVRPMHYEYVEPTKGLADVVVPWEWHNAKAVALLAARIREHVPDEDVSGKAV